MVIYLEKRNIKLSFFSVCYLFVFFRGVLVDVKNLNAEKCFLIIVKLKLFLDWTEKNLKSFYTLNHIFNLTDALANFSFFIFIKTMANQR